ncbi:MAG: tetratricopeptide repeat protein [Desulfobacterales bacterium]|nr:tetratricopeptide repeat protein [Desulfobacterales bacterium]
MVLIGDMNSTLSNKWRTLIFFAVFCIAAAILYSAAFRAPFVYDDINYITKNDPNVHMTEFSWEALKTAALEGKPKNRPLANLSFALNYYFGKENPFGYHLVNLIIHLLTAGLLFFLIRLTFGIINAKASPENVTTEAAANWMAFLAVLIWLVHPVQTNAVTYMVQRMTSMAALFYILSLLLYIKGRLAIQKTRRIRAAGFMAGCILSGLCAVFTKQNAGMLPVFILLYEWFFFQDLRPVRSKRLMFGAIAAILVFCVIGYIYLGGHPLERILSAYERRDFTLFQRVLTEWRVIAYYAGLIVFPRAGRLLLDHSYPLSDALVAPLTTLTSAGMILSVLALALYSVRKQRLVAFCLIWFVGNLVIESSVIGIEIIYEHRLYLPSMMLCLMAVWLLSRRLKQNWRVIIPIGVAVALVFSFWTYERNQIWASDVTFWKDVAKKSPQKARPLQNLAYSLQQNGRHAEAITHYQASLDIEAHPAVYFNLGLSFINEKRYVDAVNAYLNALKMGYQAPGIYQHFAYALSMAGEFKEARQQYQNAIKRNPQNESARNRLRALSQFLNECRTPIDCLNQRIDEQPENMALRFKRGVSLEERGELDAAMADYEAVLSNLSPSDRKLYLLALNRLGMVYFQTGGLDAAMDMFTKGIRLAPEEPHFYYHLAALWAIKGNPERSLSFLDQAIEKGFSDGAELKRDSRFDSLREHPGFKQLSAKISPP